MGKTAKWFRGLFSLKNDHSPSQSAAKPPKRRWSFVKSHRERDRTATKNTTTDDAVDQSKHAIAAAEKITSSGRSNATTATSAVYVSGWAVITIQAHFRGYLNHSHHRRDLGQFSVPTECRVGVYRLLHQGPYGLFRRWPELSFRAARPNLGIKQINYSNYKKTLQARRALRALKGLVKLQALVRGHIVRKRTVDVVQRMQALLRAQARACVLRAQISESPHSSNKSSQFQGPATPEKFEHAISSKITKHDQSPMLLKRSSSKSIARVIIHQDKAHNDWMGLDHHMDEGSWDRKRRHGLASDQCNHSFSTSKDSTAHPTVPSPSSCEVHSLCPLKSMQGNTEESPFCTTNNSPQFYSASSRSGSSKRGPFTPSKSDESRSNLSGHYPNYMACTESSRAKVRSLSAPKQRPQFESSVSSKRYSVHGYGESRSSSLRVSANFANKAYLGSGRLERLGMPVRGDAIWLNAAH